MPYSNLLIFLGLLSWTEWVSLAQPAATPVKPIRALLICGGCCHDYDKQKQLLAEGLARRAHIEVAIVQQGGTTTHTKIPLYEDPDWAQGYDVIIHNECFADAKDPEWTERILKPHRQGLPAVAIHCAMHCYRDGREEWFKFLGVTSHGHGKSYPHEVLTRDGAHPIMQKLGPGWWNPAGELYNIAKLWPTAHPLASTKNQENGKEEVCVWVNDFAEGTRVFGTTLGHHNETVSSSAFLDLVTRGTLWAAGKLNDAYLKPQPPQAASPSQNPGEKAALSVAWDLSPEQEAALLKDVKLPQGFAGTVFAGPPAVNYPVFVAAAPDGTIYVSSDKNGSLDRAPLRGRVLRVRDLDGDGHADEVKMFVSNVDSPRGLVWDHDRLYLMHPPHLSAFIDHDGDGIADEQKILVKNIAFSFKDRPADHTSNGIELGIDGWLYCAIGDFGFMEAEGADGGKLQLRAGGVVRVRPDGTGLELYSRGTRNIVEVAVSPLLDSFARDNTNDGDGWDIRFHQFIGLSEHGYPSLFKHFRGEILDPLAEYGGGSGCGALFLTEPGFPPGFSDSVYTADWGTEWIYRHPMMRKGASFTIDQHEFIRAPRVTDLDVDASSRLYVASWKGASFTYAGENVGFLVRVSPSGYNPEPLPDFARARAADLVTLLESPSHRRRREAQRELMRRGLTEETLGLLGGLAKDSSKPLASRVAAVFALRPGQKASPSPGLFLNLAKDDLLREYVIRRLCDDLNDLQNVPVPAVIDALSDPNPRVRQAAAWGLARLGQPGNGRALAALLSDPDPVVAHTAVQSLKSLKASSACFAMVDHPNLSGILRTRAFYVLQSLHEPAVVDGLVQRLHREKDPDRRRGLLTALCRLHFTEAPWKGESWGTRPDTSGPIYQTAVWEQSSNIVDVLKESLGQAQNEDAVFLVGELTRHKIQSADTLATVIAMAQRNAALVPSALAQLARAEGPPDAALPLLISAANAENTSSSSRAQAVVALAQFGNRQAVEAALQALGRLRLAKAGGREWQLAREAFLNGSKADQNLAFVEQEAQKLDQVTSPWADALLLKISARTTGSPEARKAAQRALDLGWTNPKRRAQLIQGAMLAEHRPWRDRIIEAVKDTDPAVSEAAREAIRVMKLEHAGKPATADAAGPMLEKLTTAEAIARALKTKGDVKLGEEVFVRQGCMNCHTVKSGDVLRGPFLGNIATLYKRAELAEAILEPNKTLAQGFIAHQIELKDGTELEGFVTKEAATQVTIRNVAAQEIIIRISDIAHRREVEKSLMPDGLAANLNMKEFASLLDYLEGLVVP